MTKKAKKADEGKLFPDQFDDEEVLFVFRKHPIVMRLGLVFGMLGPVIGLIPVTLKPDLGFGWFYGGLVAGVVIGLLIFFPSWLRWYYSVFIITNQRIIQITQKGLFSKSVVDLSLNQIQSMNYEIKGIQATMLGFGTIMIQTFMGDLVIHEIHHPAKIQKKVAMILRAQGISPANMSAEEGAA